MVEYKDQLNILAVIFTHLAFSVASFFFLPAQCRSLQCAASYELLVLSFMLWHLGELYLELSTMYSHVSVSLLHTCEHLCVCAVHSTLHYSDCHC